MHVGDADKAWPRLPVGALGKMAGATWGYVEPERGSFDWYGLDHYVAAAKRHGVDAFYAFANTPQWASARPHEHCYLGNIGCAAPPARMEYWTEFVTALATRYRGRIKFYEIWDEPSTFASWSGTYAQMAQLAAQAYRIIKSIDPGAMILTPALAGDVGWQLTGRSVDGVITDWLQKYLQAGGNRYTDGGNWHGYLMEPTGQPYRMPNDDGSPCLVRDWFYKRRCGTSILHQIGVLRAVLDRNGLAGKPIFNTEGSWGKAQFAPELQAAWLARYYLLQASAGVARVYWYAWDIDSWGTLVANGQLTRAGQAYSQMYKWLVGATITSACSSAKSGVWTCELSRPGGYRALAVWSTNGPRTFVVPRGYCQVRDLAGKVAPAAANIAIGPEPVLLETGSPRKRRRLEAPGRS